MPSYLQAYRKLALRWHPDKVDATERERASERFKRITEAYSTLSDPSKRRQYDVLGDTLPNGAARGYAFGQSGSGFGTCNGNGGFCGPADPFGFNSGGGAFPGFQFQGGPEPPPQAMRRFHCSLMELEAGCKKKVTLEDSYSSRLRDAVGGGWSGPGAQAAANLATVALSLIWRLPLLQRLVFGRPWWFRLPGLGVVWLAALCKQLPPSPSGVFEFDVKPGWRAGTRVVFKTRAGGDKSAQRNVAFELRCAP